MGVVWVLVNVTAISNSLTCSMFKVNKYNFRGNVSVDFIFPLFFSGGQLEKQRICSPRSKFFLLRADLFFKLCR